MSEALAIKKDGLPKNVAVAIATIEKEFPQEAQAVGEYLLKIKEKDVSILGEGEMFNLTDPKGEIKAFKRVIILSESDGTLVQPVPGGHFVVSAQGYEKVNTDTGTIVMNADSVLVDGTPQQNPYVLRDPKNGRILSIYSRAIAFRYSPLGIPQVSDRTTVFDVPSYRLIDLLAKAKKFPQAFKLLPEGLEPDCDGTWARYPFDENTRLWVNTSHDEALQFYSQIINREKKAIDFAQTFAQRNASKHLHGIQRAPGNVWKLTAICWKPSNENPLRWDMARYATTQKALTEIADGKTHGEFPPIEMIKGTDFMSDESENLEAELQLDEEGKGKPEPEKQKEESAATVKREDPDNPVWAQLEATKKAVPEIYEKALKKLKLKDPIETVDDAKEMMKVCNSIADGGAK